MKKLVDDHEVLKLMIAIDEIAGEGNSTLG
jgi:hypothetical protein